MESSGQLFIAAIIGVFLTIIPVLALGKNHRKTSMERMLSWFLGSPNEPMGSNDVAPSAIFKEAFPPSTRGNLSKAATSLLSSQQKCLLGLPVKQEVFRKNVMPMTADYRKCDPWKYTPTGISLEEVKALGDFPDYATLSGVPLPTHYKEFEFEKAIPRPYRPFRWNYHQTMCKQRSG